MDRSIYFPPLILGAIATAFIVARGLLKRDPLVTILNVCMWSGFVVFSSLMRAFPESRFVTDIAWIGLSLIMARTLWQIGRHLWKRARSKHVQE